MNKLESRASENANRQLLFEQLPRVAQHVQADPTAHIYIIDTKSKVGAKIIEHATPLVANLEIIDDIATIAVPGPVSAQLLRASGESVKQLVVDQPPAGYTIIVICANNTVEQNRFIVG